MMFSASSLFVFATLSTCIHCRSISPTPTTFTNSSSPSSATSSAAIQPTNCCFVIQETARADYWPVQNVTYTTLDVNLTSITTLITPYRNGTITNVVTNVYATNASFPVTQTLGNPLGQYANNAFHFQEVDRSLDGPSVVTAGVTVQSPQAYYLYTTVKVITARPVTNTDGQVMCGTVSSWDAPNFYGVQATFSNINSNAAAHFGGSNIGGVRVLPTTTATSTYTRRIGGSFYRYTLTETAVGSWFTNLEGQTVEPTIASNGLEITLTTPFIYQPTQGANPATGDPRPCFQGGESENFGYVPQTLIDFLANDRGYLRQYPDLASCLPAGPSILPVIDGCKIPFQEIIQDGVGGDLTESTVSTVMPPTNTANPPIPPPGSPTTNPGVPLEITGSPNTAVAPPGPPPGEKIDSAVSSIMGESATSTPTIGSTTTIDGTPLLVIQPTSIAIANAPAGLTGSTTVVGGTPFLIVPTPTTIAALPGSVAIISGSAFDVFTGPTTVAVNPNLPIQGATTIISGTPMVIIPSATTVAILPGSLTVISGTTYDSFSGPTLVLVNPNLPLDGVRTVISGTTFVQIPSATLVPVLPAGSLTLISGTWYDVFSGPATVPVNGELSLSGRTTVIGGVTEVVLSAATTVPVLNPSRPAYVQVSGASRGRNSLVEFGFEVVRGFFMRFR